MFLYNHYNFIAHGFVIQRKKRRHILNKREIIRGQQEISIIFQNGIFLRGRLFDLIYIAADKRQMGVATSKRIRTAVMRNRIKRMLREAYRFEKMNFNECVKTILVGNEKTIKAHLNDLRQEMRQMANRIASNQ